MHAMAYGRRINACRGNHSAIENCMHIFCETLNDIHSSATIDKYRVFTFVCVSLLSQVGGIDADHDQRNLNIFLTIANSAWHQGALAMQQNSNDSPFKSNQQSFFNKSQRKKKKHPHESNRPNSNHKTIPFDSLSFSIRYDTIRFNAQAHNTKWNLFRWFLICSASIRQY